MRIEVSAIDDVPNSMYIEFYGRWDRSQVELLVGQITQQKPMYLVVDPTGSVLASDANENIFEATPQRRRIVEQIVALMQENPLMLYIVINRNDNAILKTAIPLYKELGIEDRYLFVKTPAEAFQIVHKHHATHQSD